MSSSSALEWSPGIEIRLDQRVFFFNVDTSILYESYSINGEVVINDLAKIGTIGTTSIR